jgi:hypothetical protein
LTGLLRQSVFGRLGGYEDVNDAERLAHDPAMRAVVDRTRLDCQAASTSQMGRFEIGWLTSEANLAALADLSGTWIDRVHARRPQTTIALDMDSSVSETHGVATGRADWRQGNCVQMPPYRGTFSVGPNSTTNRTGRGRHHCPSAVAKAVRWRVGYLSDSRMAGHLGIVGSKPVPRWQVGVGTAEYLCMPTYRKGNDHHGIHCRARRPDERVEI